MSTTEGRAKQRISRIMPIAQLASLGMIICGAATLVGWGTPWTGRVFIVAFIAFSLSVAYMSLNFLRMMTADPAANTNNAE